MLGTGARVVLKIFKISNTSFLGDCFCLFFIFGELGIWRNQSTVLLVHMQYRLTDIFGNLRER